MDIKQKSLLVLTLAALGFLGYQVFQLVDRDITQTPVIAQQQYNTTTPDTPTRPVAAVTVATPVATVTSPTATLVSTPTAIKPATVTTATAAPQITPEQHAYIQALDSYEMARMHHQLLDEEAAIAAAQQKIAMMRTQTAKIVGNTSGVATDSDDALVAKPAENFVLSYIDRQNGQWSATLHVGSDYESVEIGSHLPNGYEVKGIDHDGVTLQKGALRELVSFNGTDILPALPVAVHTVQPTLKQNSPVIVAPVKVAPHVASRHPNLMVASTPAQKTASSATPVVTASLATPALQKTVAPPVVQKPAQLPYQISIHDMNAEEGLDDLDNTQLSMDLNLRSVEIMPVMTQAYNTDAYLPRAAPIPQTYHLDSDVSADTEQQYSIEARDDQAPRIHPISLAQHKMLKLPSQSYTIQLLGSADATVISQFITRNHLQHLALKLPVGVADHPWVIALYGSYPSFAAAEEKLVELSPRIREKGAWVRRVGDIQKVVRSRFLS